jgi:hypothetical protein
MISVVESVMKGSYFMKAKGYAPSNLGRASEIGRLRTDRGAVAAQDKMPSGAAIGAHRRSLNLRYGPWFRQGLTLRHCNDERISVMLTLIGEDHRIRARDGRVRSQFFDRIDRRFRGLADAVSWPNGGSVLCRWPGRR